MQCLKGVDENDRSEHTQFTMESVIAVGGDKS